MTTKRTSKKIKPEEAEPEVLSVDEATDEEEATQPEPTPQPEPEVKPEETEPTPESGNVVEVIVKEEPPESNIYVYLGPNIRSGALRKNQIFKGGKPVIPGFTDVYPIAYELFVPINERLEAMKQINKKGTLLNLAYENIKGV